MFGNQATGMQLAVYLHSHALLSILNFTTFVYNYIIFNALRTVDGHLHPTFKSACATLNLIENEQEVLNYIDEVVSEQFPRTLRVCFALLLCNVNPVDPRGLWDRYNQELAADYLYDLVDDQELAFQLCLNDICEILLEFGKSLEDYHLPALNEEVLGRRAPNVEVPSNNLAKPNRLVETLNVEQLIDCLYQRNENKCFFLTGPGGSGKTYTYNILIDYLEATGRSSVVAANTGVAANLLQHGLTSHNV
ncbi:ATP-dependent DNA helicase, partial [Frankliniella fusca]